MRAINSRDGAQLRWRVIGVAADELVCIPGGPLSSSRYLGDLGGLNARCQLLMLELPARRVDRLVEDLEALRAHLGHERLNILAHSAGSALAMLYAIAHPGRIGKLALITPTVRPVGIEVPEAERRRLLERRSGASWYREARAAVHAQQQGDISPATRLAAAPFLYGRWDESARLHAAGEPQETTPNAAGVYFGDGAYDPEAVRTGLSSVTADVLVAVGELDPVLTERAGKELAGLFPRSVVVVQKSAGHFPWVDDPAFFTTMVASFLGYG